MPYEAICIPLTFQQPIYSHDILENQSKLFSASRKPDFLGPGDWRFGCGGHLLAWFLKSFSTVGSRGSGDGVEIRSAGFGCILESVL